MNKRTSQDTSRLQSCLFDLKEFNVEDQLRVGRNAGKSLLAVRQVRRNRDTTLTTDSHASNTNIPALDDLTLAKLECERLALLVGCQDGDLLVFYQYCLFA